VPATNVVLRRRIVDRLASAADARVTVILAPTGYGKSTAIQQFIATRSGPHIVFSARPDDKALIGFARGLIESSPPLSRLALPSLNGAYSSAMRSGEPGLVLAEWLMMFLRELPADTLIAIDDAQFGNDDPQTTRFIAALVDGTKDHTKWLIAIRSAYNLPLGEWFAQGDMGLPLDSIDLAFTADELRSLVGTMELKDVAGSVLDQWRDALDGWPTAILLALSSGIFELGAPPPGLTPDELFPVLADRFFEMLTDRQRAFLKVAVKLRNIDPALCLAAGITDVHQLSAGLVRAGVLVPYGSDRTALRLHDLFVARVESDLYNETWLSWAHRICELLEERGRISDALELSLKLNDVSRATGIVRNHGFSLWGSLHADLISRTIAFINTDTSPQTDPAILNLQGMQMYRQGNVTDGMRLAMQALELATDPLTRARIAAHQTIGSIVAQRLPPFDPALMEVDAGSDALAVADLAGAQAMLLAARGSYSRARQVISETIRRLQLLPENAFASIQFSIYASAASWLTGDLDQAVEYSAAAVRDANDIGQLGVVTIAYSYLILIGLARGDEIDILVDYAKERERNHVRSGHMQTMGVSRLFRLVVAVAAGDESIADIEREIRQVASPEFTREFSAGRAKDIAIRYTWNRSFGEAQKLVAIAAPNLGLQEDLVRLGALAMYAAAAGQREESLVTIARIEEVVQTLAFDGIGHQLWRNLCRIYEAFAFLILRDEDGARRCLALVDGYTGPLVGGMEAVARGLAEHNVAMTQDGLQLIRRRGYLGYARMLEQIERCIARERFGTTKTKVKTDTRG
jgi:ATP/maltotriose-dependent transcriptional regulator MalT